MPYSLPNTGSVTPYSNPKYESADQGSSWALEGTDLSSSNLRASLPDYQSQTKLSRSEVLPSTTPVSNLSARSVPDTYSTNFSSLVSGSTSPWWMNQTSIGNVFPNTSPGRQLALELASSPSTSALSGFNTSLGYREDTSMYPVFSDLGNILSKDPATAINNTDFISGMFSTALKDLKGEGLDYSKDVSEWGPQVVDKVVTSLRNKGYSLSDPSLADSLSVKLISDGQEGSSKGVFTIDPTYVDQFRTYFADSLRSLDKFSSNGATIMAARSAGKERLVTLIENTKDLSPTDRQRYWNKDTEIKDAADAVRESLKSMPNGPEKRQLETKVESADRAWRRGTPDGQDTALTEYEAAQQLIPGVTEAVETASKYVKNDVTELLDNHSKDKATVSSLISVNENKSKVTRASELDLKISALSKKLDSIPTTSPQYELIHTQLTRAVGEYSTLSATMLAASHKSGFKTTFADPDREPEYDSSAMFATAIAVGGLLASVYQQKSDSDFRKDQLDYLKDQDALDREERDKDRAAMLAATAMRAGASEPKRGSGPAAQSASALKPVTVA